MDSYKVRVNNKAESKEVQELFFKLGGTWGGFKKIQDWDNINQLYLQSRHITYSNDIDHFNNDPLEEITIPQLRDLVVLKRNDVNDATHVNLVTGSKVLQQGDKNYYWQLGEWHLYPCGVDIKPIEKEMKMKEYLNPLKAGGYELSNDALCDDSIEVPEGMNFAWEDNNSFWLTPLCMGYRDAKIVWQRESLNDKVASAEVARQAQKSTAWDKQTGGDHYKKLAIQPMEYALKNKLDYAQANVVKYVTRHADKNGKEDLLKAIHNIELMIEHYYGETK